MPQAARNIPTRPKTRKRYDAFADRRRLKLVEVSDLAIAALESLPTEKLDHLIEHGRISPAPATR
jgi:hypothetical protein